MTHAVWEPFAGDPMTPGQRPPQLATVLAVKATTTHDGASFAAGADCGTRVAACIARVAALELIDGSRWWNRRSHRLMARALVACAEELEAAADAGGRCAPLGRRLTDARSTLRLV
jgi:hypothetical protein